ncbi:MAG: hypothetical protein QW638_08520, partial [Candidatus Bathyarchaeia archaeon]
PEGRRWIELILRILCLRIVSTTRGMSLTSLSSLDATAESYPLDLDLAIIEGTRGSRSPITGV